MPTTATDPKILAQLDEPYALTEEQITRFREDGFVKLPNFWSAELLAHYDDIITRLTLSLNPKKDVPLKDRSTYDQAFIQVGNLWKKDAQAQELAHSKRGAQAAAQLMGTNGTRMWHDQALYKEAAGGFTPWHVDQQYWPMASGHSVTMWMPFTAVPIEMGPLCFGRGSHLKNIGRDIEISDDSEQLIREAIKANGVLEIFEPYALGDVTFHYGWTLHRAGPNTTTDSRRVFTVIYMDEQMRLAEPKNQNQKNDWNSWTPSTKLGEVMDDVLNPVLYSAG